ncbi:hypothetical protein J1N35_013042 [Gossypium stocksii]|uniref:Uncharacterized protein n=1 Tax=Gossypium stocksii TaxID=47602 RepID=A0A9D3VU56_9ROSI|nr:hypothetical protein J1N35_013042 [Gossypium stocksii]
MRLTGITAGRTRLKAGAEKAMAMVNAGDRGSSSLTGTTTMSLLKNEQDDATVIGDRRQRKRETERPPEWKRLSTGSGARQVYNQLNE